MKDFKDKIAVVTGGGTGMGRALTLQLVSEGCHVAICDVSAENMAETKRLATVQAPQVRVTTFVADVSNEAHMIAFRDAVIADQATNHINLLFNNAGIGGGGSFLIDERSDWERTFGVCWYGVYSLGCFLMDEPEAALVVRQRRFTDLRRGARTQRRDHVRSTGANCVAMRRFQRPGWSTKS